MLELEQGTKDFLYFLEFGDGRGNNTIKSIRSDLKQFSEYLISKDNGIKLSEINQLNIRGFLSHLNNQQVGKRSINRKLSTLRSFFKYLQKNGFIDKNPAMLVDSPEFEMDAPDFLKIKEICTLREAVETDSTNGLRDRLIIELLYSSGLTSQELLQLGEGVIDRDLREIKIFNGKHSRIVFFSERAGEYLSRYLKAKKEKYGEKYNRDIIFVNGSATRLSDRSLRRILDRYALKAGLKREITPHMFRHTYALYLLAKDMDIKYLQELLGHKTLELTKNYLEILKIFKSENGL